MDPNAPTKADLEQVVGITVTRHMVARPPAAGFAELPRRRDQGPEVRPAHGPNLLGELCWPVIATYDADADRTRVGFSFIAPAEQQS